MPDATTYHDGFDLDTAEPVRVEVSALYGGPVTLTASTPVKSIPLTPGEASRLGTLLARATTAARTGKAPRTAT